MPGKESDFPSRKQRKAAGKNNIRGRAGVEGSSLPLYESARSMSPNDMAGLNPTYPKVDNSTLSTGYVTDFPRQQPYQ